MRAADPSSPVGDRPPAPEPATAPGSRAPRGRRPRSGRIALITLALVAAFLAGSLEWRSMPKAELGRRLAALAKNRGMGAPSRIPLPPRPSDGSTSEELVFAHAAARSPSARRAPVVLVHGTPSTFYTWTEVMHGGDPGTFDGLREDRDVFAIEVVGHGIAPPHQGAVDFQRAADFVARAVRALDLPPVHVVGSSYGGEFVWRAALDAPELFASVTLLDSSGIARREADWLSEEIAMRENPLAKQGWRLNSRARIEAALAPHFDGLPPDRVEEFFLVCSNESNWRAMVELARDENGTRAGELGALDRPVLLLWGGADQAYDLDFYARRFADALPNARLSVLPGVGHYPHEQVPARVVAELRAFFDEVEASRAGLSTGDAPPAPRAGD